MQPASIFVGFHFVGIEAGCMMYSTRHPVASLYTPMSNLLLDAMAKRQRGRFGTEMIPRSDSVRRALRALRGAGLRLAAITNNMEPLAGTRADLVDVLDLFEVVVESSVEGIRKPEVAFFEIVLQRLGVAADECVYLDDLGINLKPARALGMTTIKVTDQGSALAELGQATGVAIAT